MQYAITVFSIFMVLQHYYHKMLNFCILLYALEDLLINNSMCIGVFEYNGNSRRSTPKGTVDFYFKTLSGMGVHTYKRGECLKMLFSRPL